MMSIRVVQLFFFIANVRERIATHTNISLHNAQGARSTSSQQLLCVGA
jgi:hypothetical protein